MHEQGVSGRILHFRGLNLVIEGHDSKETTPIIDVMQLGAYLILCVLAISVSTDGHSLRQLDVCGTLSSCNTLDHSPRSLWSFSQARVVGSCLQDTDATREH